ncbi:nickel pincer cofactor biosynthesis protein LarC [Waterburya agarophytonicola K14]|uniref:Putative nickel insertion protein n=1 Tax=Waterburya agarophytonicola KI4 TaxID=2874699 RepID=A0A964FH49_9CYAN|nr:nickel pincer cofactor biosynthesis protein LarC [Waterburya agarophytonicola]MCC0178796.1 nickel pincer cofactor biosynthesis protein LarC [Waterburya agarophytonicola KI4]
MGKICYLECPTGIAGDMCLGALIDCGLPWQYLIDSLGLLGIESEYQLRTEKVIRNGQAATKVYVNLQVEHKHTHDDHHHHHYPARHLPEIENLIKNARLKDRVKEWSLAIFNQLAIAESQVHGIPPEKVHFHEVGATDAIVDIVGTCIGLDWLDIEELYCSAMPTGGGTVKAAHGLLSVPVPAVVKLWETRKVPIYSNGIKKELVTPTGAAIAVTLASGFGDPPAMKLTKMGLGAGSQDFEIPNILRLWLGEKETERRGEKETVRETVTVLETQIDDLNPQAVAYTLEQLIAAGALDVFTQNIGMKKSRSGILLTVICHPTLANTCKTIIFKETTTLGIRERNQQRNILDRQLKSISTKYGTLKVKIASWGTGKEREVINIQPEYEDCAILARKHNIPWREIAQQAIIAWESDR